MLKNLFCIVLFATCLPMMAEYVTKTDIPYYDADFPRTGDSAYIDERCKLDLCYPEHRKNFSTVVVFHGGGLIRGQKGPHTSLQGRGFAVVSANYRLSKRAKCPEYIYDAAAAVAWTIKHIAEYGGNPDRVFVAGHSAGGYLTAMIALDPKYLESFGVSPSKLAGALPSSGQMTTHYQVINEYRMQGKPYAKVMIDEYAPISHINPKAPPLIFTVGDDASEVAGRVGENKMIHSLLVKAEHPNCQFFQYPGFAHGQAWHPAMQKLWMWIQSVERADKRREARKAKKGK